MNALERPRFPIRLLLLVLALAGLYVRSYWRADVLGIYVSDGKLQAIASRKGRFVVAVSNISFGEGMHWTWDYTAADTDEAEGLLQQSFPATSVFGLASSGGLFVNGGSASAASPSTWPPIWERIGFAFGLSTVQLNPPAKAWVNYVVIPQWILSPLLLVLLVALLRWRRFRARAKRGLCQYCGYDLRSSPERCPECGNEVPGKKIAAAATE